MTRRIILLVICCLLTVSYIFAFTQDVVIPLNNDNNFKYTYTAEPNNICDINVEVVLDRYGENPSIIIQIKNPDSRYGLIVFKGDYDEKGKKNLKNNDFYEVNTANNSLKVNTLPCELPHGNGLMQNVFINYNETQSLVTDFPMKIKDNELMMIKLPIYICDIELNKKKDKINKLKLLEYHEYTLQITADFGPDTVYEHLEQQYEDYAHKLSTAEFCPDRRHKPKLQDQINQFNKDGERLKDEISEKKKEFQSTSQKGKKYKNLQSRIDSVYSAATDSSNIKLCPRHQPDKKCSKCNRSYGKCKKRCKHGNKCQCEEPPKCKCGVPVSQCKYNGKHYEHKAVKDSLNSLSRKIDNKKKEGMTKEKAQKELNSLKYKAGSIINESQKQDALALANKIQEKINRTTW